MRTAVRGKDEKMRAVVITEDKKLELKLQRLDNEREQITNEIDALDKVISDNIQGSYKTFSG